MTLAAIPLDEITEDHLRRLIAAQAPETLYVEYKRQTYGGSDDQRREFLGDVSSFANTAGGVLIIGMSASNGIPTAIEAHQEDADAEVLRLEQIARDGLSPRITNLRTRAVPIAGGGSVIVLRVPRSYARPHRIIFKNSGRFWARSSAGKYEPNVEELRRIFTEAPLLAERIRSFRIERVAQIGGNGAPVGLLDACNLVLHVVPFSAFDFSGGAPLDAIAAEPHLFPPIGGYGRYWQITIDGFLNTPSAEGISAPQRAYVQVFRSGAVEAVASLSRGDGAEVLVYPNIERLIVRHAYGYASTLRRFGIEPPYAVLASIVGAKGSRLLQSAPGHLWVDNAYATVRDDQLHFVESVLETVPAERWTSWETTEGDARSLGECSWASVVALFRRSRKLHVVRIEFCKHLIMA